MVHINNTYFYYEHTVNFSVSQYAEMLLIHFLAYTILGPLICLHPYLFRKSSPWLVSNLQLSRVGSRGFYIQHMGWVFNCIYFYLYFFSRSKVADYPLMLYLIIAYVVRCSSIAGKYATFPANQYRKIKEIYIPDKEIRGEMMLMSWWQQTPRVVALELRCTINRLDIDRALFKIAFLADVNEKSLDSMSQILIENHRHINKDSKPIHENLTLKNQQGLTYFDGQVVLEFFIREYNKTQSLPKIALAGIFLLTLTFVFSTAFFRAIVG